MTSPAFSFNKEVFTTKHFSIKLDYPIQEVLFIKKNKIFVILYDRDSNIRKWGQFPNLIGLSNSGEKLWVAELPTTDTGDSYFDVQLEEGKLIADSVRSFSCEINPLNGKIIHKTFFK